MSKHGNYTNFLKEEKLKRSLKQQEYYDTIKKVIVTYHDGGKKEFTPDNWFIFEDKVRPIAKKVEVVKY